MEAFTKLTGLAAPLDRVNADTDQIIPKQFLKTVDREGLARGLFYDMRFDPEGNAKSGFVLDDPVFARAGVLIAGDNFGCGSSREHAPWALLDFGIRCVISTSFGDIFYNNCFKNGMLPVTLPEKTITMLLARAKAPGYQMTVDLEKLTISDESGFSESFEVDAFRRHCLLNGQDDIGLTLQHEPDITAYEARRPVWTRGTVAI